VRNMEVWADETDQRSLARLQERWPDMEIRREWFGFMAYPKGTDPVVFATYADGIDAQLTRIRADADGVTRET
jgi:hypothetical protein